MVNNYPFVAHRSPDGEGKMGMRRVFPREYTHQHIYFELVYVLRGSAKRKLADTVIPVSAGDYYIANPHSLHSHEDTQDFEIISCLFLPEYIDRALTDCPSVSSLLSNQIRRFGVPVDISIADRVFHDPDGTVRRIIKNMEREHTECRTGYVEMLRCYLTQILVHAARASELRFPHEAVTTVMEHLSTHYAEPISLDTLSQLTGYTPQYLSSLFSEEAGMSIQACLQRVRVERACHLLSHTERSIAEISAAVGYQDTRHFSKIFRRYCSISPRDYRKNIRDEAGTADYLIP